MPSGRRRRCGGSFSREPSCAAGEVLPEGCIPAPVDGDVLSAAPGDTRWVSDESESREYLSCAFISAKEDACGNRLFKRRAPISEATDNRFHRVMRFRVAGVIDLLLANCLASNADPGIRMLRIAVSLSAVAPESAPVFLVKPAFSEGGEGLILLALKDLTVNNRSLKSLSCGLDRKEARGCKSFSLSERLPCRVPAWEPAEICRII